MMKKQDISWRAGVGGKGFGLWGMVLLVCVVMGLGVGGLGGCVSGKVKEGAGSGEESDGGISGGMTAWPGPPGKAKVVYRQVVRGLGDLVEVSFFDRLGQAITGGRSQVMLKPHGVAVGKGKLVVTDQDLRCVHVFDLKAGKHVMVEEVGGQELVLPVGVAICGEEVAVSDSGSGKVWLMSWDGKKSRELAGVGGGWGRPTGLAFDGKRGWLYVVDTLGCQVVVMRLDGTQVKRFGERGVGPGQLNYPTHVALDGEGRAVVTDSLNFRVQGFDLEGRYLFQIGTLGDATGHLAVPKGVAVDRWGHIYIVDSYFSAVQVWDREGRFLLSFGSPGTRRGEFGVPTGLCVDEEDRLYVSDSENERVQIFQYVGGSDDEKPTTQP